MSTKVLQNRVYKGEIIDGYIYYNRVQRRMRKDGTVRTYPNRVRKPRPTPTWRGPDKKKRKKGSGVYPRKKKSEVTNFQSPLKNTKDHK